MTIEGAIVELQNLIKADDVPFYYNGAIQKVIETIIDECKPKVGNWIRIGYDIYECSECHQYVKTSDIDAYDWCHHCGAKMERSE